MVRVFTIDSDGTITEVLSDAEKARRQRQREAEEFFALLLLLLLLTA